MTDLTTSPAWTALVHHQKKISKMHMRGLFAADENRFEKFSVICEGLLLDYSKNRITEETVALLLDLARAQDIETWRDRMFSGEKINTSEDRAVLHTALRNRSENPVMVDGKDVMPNVRKTLETMRTLSESVRNGAWTGHSGKRITDVVNIGIGGQHFGVHMLAHALLPYKGDIDGHFVTNVDGSDITETLKKCDPETTLFLISSKSFTTQETMANAATAKTWILSHHGTEDAVKSHFIALSSRTDLVQEFGIAPENILGFEDWVGGRLSTWSCSGLILAILYGMDRFDDLLAGAYAMDTHFRTAPLEKNMPVILALLGIWYRNFWDMGSYAVTPYDYYLRYFLEWLQQVDMESNGKRIDRRGQPVTCQTGPVVFGMTGSIAQHAFIQLIHQGTQIIPVDFIAPKQSHNMIGDHHHMLLSNFLAQTEALMLGRDHDDPGRAFPGNRPTNSLLIEKLDPYHLGMLMALYEHKIFVQGVIWNINSFDQFGVELGKEMANTLLDSLKSGNPGKHDSSTAGLLKEILKR